MSFYVTLPSNASMVLYPANNPGHYFVKLPQTLDLNAQYDVGLVEIQFPNSYFNVLEGDAWLEFTPDNPPGLITRTTKLSLPAGLYKSASDFIDDINYLVGNLERELKSDNSIFRVHFDPRSKRAIVKLYAQAVQVQISERLANILGLTETLATTNTPVLHGDTLVELDSPMNNIYVYCDLVSSRVVGDVMVPLLRTVPILDRSTASVFRIYDKPHYISLSRFSFDTVEILLTTEFGQTLPFKSGTSVLTLHFRSRRRFDFD